MDKLLYDSAPKRSVESAWLPCERVFVQKICPSPLRYGVERSVLEPYVPIRAVPRGAECEEDVDTLSNGVAPMYWSRVFHSKKS